MQTARAILIAGPTASGKSALAVALPHGTNGVVVNADSMQVYRDLAILTARPDAADAAGACRMRSTAMSPAARPIRSAAGWPMSRRCWRRPGEHGLLPVIVGGTGLYFKALLEGLSPIPPIPAASATTGGRSRRGRGRPRCMPTCPPRSGDGRRLRPTDPQRIDARAGGAGGDRAWPARMAARARAPAARSGDRCAPRRGRRSVTSCIARADARFDAMIAAGALDEVERLAARRLEPRPAGDAGARGGAARSIACAGSRRLPTRSSAPSSTRGSTSSGRRPGFDDNMISWKSHLLRKIWKELRLETLL